MVILIKEVAVWICSELKSLLIEIFFYVPARVWRFAYANKRQCVNYVEAHCVLVYLKSCKCVEGLNGNLYLCKCYNFQCQRERERERIGGG